MKGLMNLLQELVIRIAKNPTTYFQEHKKFMQMNQFKFLYCCCCISMNFLYEF